MGPLNYYCTNRKIYAWQVEYLTEESDCARLGPPPNSGGTTLGVPTRPGK